MKRPNTSAVSSRYVITSQKTSGNQTSGNDSSLRTAVKGSVEREVVSTNAPRPSTSQIFRRGKSNQRARTPGLKTKDPKRVRRIFIEKATNKSVDLIDYHTAASDWTVTLNEKGKSIVKNSQQDVGKSQTPMSPIVNHERKVTGKFHNKLQSSFYEHERPSTTGKRPITPFPLRPLTCSETTPRKGLSRPVSPIKPPPQFVKDNEDCSEMALPCSDDSVDSRQNKIDSKKKHALASNPWETNLNHTVPRPLTAAADLAKTTPNKRFTAMPAKSTEQPRQVPLMASDSVRKNRKNPNKNRKKLLRPYTTALVNSKSAAGKLFRFNKKSGQFERKKSRPVTWNPSSQSGIADEKSIAEQEKRSTAKQHPDDPDGYVEMVDLLGSHKMARQSQALYSKLQEEEAVRFYEQWQNESTILELAKKEMRRWGTSGTDISLNKVQRQMARSFLPPPLQGELIEEVDSDTRDAQILAKAARSSFVTGCIEIVWAKMQSLQRSALLNTMMLQVFNLVSVRLPGNKLKRIPLWFCKTFHKVKDLYLGSNELVELPENFGDMTSLVHLNLTHNRLPRIPHSIERMTCLVSLDLSDNELGSIPEQIGACQRLIKVHLDANNLIRLPSTVRKLPRLVELTTDCNRIGTLALIPSLERLKSGSSTSSEAALLWEKRELGNGRIVFINRFTGEMQDTDPTIESKDELADKKRPCKLKESVTPTLSSLAAEDKTVWELKFDFRTGRSYYFNNLTRVRKAEVPPAIDTIGKTISLRRLVVSSNAMMHLPKSIGKLPSLEELVLDHNMIYELPSSISNLTRLTLLSIADNRLSNLPDELTTLPRLLKLAVNRNMLVSLPLYLGNLTRLKSLWINNNAIEELPWTMGRMEGLKELMIGDNPVERRWRNVLEGEGKIPRMLQIMRELRLRALHGEPPAVSITSVGLLDEIIVPLPRKKKLWDTFCHEAEESGYVDLHWNQLRAVPTEIISIKSLIELRVSNNLLKELPLELGELTNLKLLHLTNNKLTELPGDAFVKLKALVELCAEDNQITHLPDKITRLFRLQVVRLCRNRISSLPEKIGKLDALCVLELNVNRLRNVPESLGALHRLTRLCLQKNRIRNLPSDMSQMTSLEILNVNSNSLRKLPTDISNLPSLREARFGQNRIQHVASNFGDGVCRSSLEVLWLMGNAIVDIPRTTYKLDKLKEIRFEDTPVRSPPPNIALCGADAVRKYSRARETRIDCLRVALRAAGVIMEARNLSPFPHGIMRTLGYLRPEDVVNVESRVDLCVNGDFMANETSFLELGTKRLLPSAGREEDQKNLTSVLEAQAGSDLHPADAYNLRMGATLATYVKDLFDLRRHEHDECVLNSILQRIEIAEKIGFNKPGGLSNLWHEYDTRKWEEGTTNRNGATGQVHVVVLAELGILDPGQIGPQPIPFSLADVITSAGRFVNVYGFQSAEKISFRFQKPAKNETSRARKKVEGKKVKRPALVIQRVIVSIEEYERKKHEDDTLLKRTTQTRERCLAWLDTSYGRMRTRARARLQMSEAKRDLRDANQELRRAKAKLSKAEEALQQLNERIRLFKEGEPRVMHQLDSEAQANALREDAESKISDCKDEVNDRDSAFIKCKTRRKQKWKKWISNCREDLIEKYTNETRDSIVNQGRLTAYAYGGETSLRRPWDADYRRWKRKHVKMLKVKAKREKEERFQRAAEESEARRAPKQKEERPQYVYDNSVMGQFKGYMRDIKAGCFGSCAKGLSHLAEITGTTSDEHDPFRWPERLQVGSDGDDDTREEQGKKQKKKKKKKKKKK